MASKKASFSSLRGFTFGLEEEEEEEKKVSKVPHQSFSKEKSNVSGESKFKMGALDQKRMASVEMDLHTSYDGDDSFQTARSHFTEKDFAYLFLDFALNAQPLVHPAGPVNKATESPLKAKK